MENNLQPRLLESAGGNSLAAYASGLETKLKICDMLLKSGMLPTSLKSAQAVLAVMLKGQEYGFAPMQACELFDFIQGRCAMRVAGMVALCQQEGGVFNIVKESPEECTIKAVRPSRKWEQSYTFKMSQAKAMGLSGKDNWVKMPEFMLYARCISVLCRRGWADILAGLYSSEEMSDGADAIDVTPQAAPKVTATATVKVAEIARAVEGKAVIDPGMVALRYNITSMPEDKRENAIAYLNQHQAKRLDENLFEAPYALAKLAKYEVADEQK